MDRDVLLRLAGVALLGLIGLVLFGTTLRRVLTGAGPLPGLALAAVGALVALVVIAAAGYLLQSSIAPNHVLRIAGWATLGTVVLGVVLGLMALAELAVPPFAAATLLAVSAFAHVLIGVRDVQRIRATELARQREKLSVVNRLVRHNLRHEAQLLYGTASRIPGAETTTDRASLAADVESVGERLSNVNDVLDRSESLFEDRGEKAVAVDLSELLEAVAAEYRETHPDAEITVDAPEECTVAAGEQLRSAVEELVENAIVHSGDSARVELSATAASDRVWLRIADDGPGIPETDRAVVTREAEITQLTHGQGLGLWFVRWVMDAYDGTVSIDGAGEGTTVELALPRGGRSKRGAWS